MREYTAQEVASSVDSIINNGIEEAGASDLESLTADELRTILNRVSVFVGSI